MIEVRTATGEDDLRRALELRHEVFVGEQGVAAEEEVDGLDDEAEHLVAADESGVVGTCRLLHAPGATTRLGRMAVARRMRRRGVATRLLAEAEQAALRAGSRQLVLHAQTDALALYELAGYQARGERFMEAGIEHLAMVKPLTSRAADAPGA